MIFERTHDGPRPYGSTYNEVKHNNMEVLQFATSYNEATDSYLTSVTFECGCHGLQGHKNEDFSGSSLPPSLKVKLVRTRRTPRRGSKVVE